MSEVNLWVRANLETFCPETLALIPRNLHEDYARVMKQKAHAKAIASLALEQVYLAEQECDIFFTNAKEQRDV